MKSPLGKRQLRMLKRDWKKYAVLFLLLVMTIGFVAGMFVANDSMETAAIEAYDKYNIEHGHFELKDKATDTLISCFEKEDIQIYEQFYKDFEEDSDGDGKKDAKIRVFQMRGQVNLACLMEGVFPEKKDEIAIDRMHADNAGIRVGDRISLSGHSVKVTGLVASSDYSTLYENASDLMFDAITFDIGFMTEEGYQAISGKQVYQYAYQFDQAPADEEEQKAWSDDLVEQLAILSATGGYTDDKDEAEELEEHIEEWTDYLEEIKEKADRAEELKEELEQEQKELEQKASDRQYVMQLLTGAGYDLTQIMTMSEEQIAGIVQEVLMTDEMQEKLRELTGIGEDLEKEEDRIKETTDRLEALEPYEDDINEITDFVPEYANQAIHFAPNDMGSDKAMGEVLLIMLVVILAFIFAVTVNNTIIKDSAVIGTLRASGYTRGEMLRHYIALPVIVTLLAAVVGNILGYSVFKDVVVAMYYNSYSLPSYVTLWNMDAFVKTTVIPVVLVVVINVLVVSGKLRIAPLRFLRHDLSTSRRKKAVRLPAFPFMTRLRLRIFFQSLGDYVVLFVGICFVSLLLSFAIGLPSTLEHYADGFGDMLLSKYQYVLKDYKDEDDRIITTNTKGAETYSVTSLKTIDGIHVGEEITVYGCIDGTDYFPISEGLTEANRKIVADEDSTDTDRKAAKDTDSADTDRKTVNTVPIPVAVSTAYAEKFHLSQGDSITLKETYESTTYEFYVEEIVDYEAALAVFMPMTVFNETFDMEADAFAGYISNEKITDIDEDYIVQEITQDDFMKIVNQLNHSMGGYMDYFAVICVGMAALLIYLLTKLIIEKNAVSISMVKVLGYTNGEINSIYIVLTSIVTVLSALVSLLISVAGIQAMWESVMAELNGWFAIYMGRNDFVEIFVLIMVAYIIVAFFDVRRIRKVPLTEALKNVE
ncbi:MAG: ABC transporter permease [Lachnospiraceae bacterium]|nr:ABC transporter permease [Lachnospiraceae bacterium]